MKTFLIVFYGMIAAGLILLMISSRSEKLERTGGAYLEKAVRGTGKGSSSKWVRFSEEYSEGDNDSRAKNYLHNLEVWESSGIKGRLIESGQDTEPQRNFRLGNYSFGYNGCEVIAAYNFLLLNGRECELPELIYEFETNALAVKGGVFGSDAKKIAYLLEAEEIPYTKLKDRDQCDKALAEGKNIIISFWTGRPLMSSIHTVTVTGGDTFYVLNMFNTVTGKRRIDSVSELAERESCFITAFSSELPS